MPDPLDPASSSPSNSTNTRRKTKAARATPPRLLLITDLGRFVGRQLITSIDEQMQVLLPHWRISIRHREDVDLQAAAKPETLHFDATLLDSGSTPTILHRAGRPDTKFLLNQRLAGSLLADVMLRRGYQQFRWRGESIRHLPETSEFALGFHDEMRHAGLSVDEHFVVTENPCLSSLATISAASHAEAPPAMVASLSIVRSGSEGPPSLGVAPSPHWLAKAVLDQLTDDAQVTSTALPISPAPPIPPVLTISAAEIARLPNDFSDPLIAEVSSRIDQGLLQHCATDAAELSAEFSTARRTLERRFREQLGTSIHREITRRQIAAARNHLLLPGTSPSLAAKFSGYPTTRMLSINFRKIHGLSPRAYQRKHLET